MNLLKPVELGADFLAAVEHQMTYFLLCDRYRVLKKVDAVKKEVTEGVLSAVDNGKLVSRIIVRDAEAIEHSIRFDRCITWDLKKFLNERVSVTQLTERLRIPVLYEYHLVETMIEVLSGDCKGKRFLVRDLKGRLFGARHGGHTEFAGADGLEYFSIEAMRAR